MYCCRQSAETRLASRTNTCVVIKGAGSASAEANGEWSVNDSGGPSLATGGTGDVLAGVVAALLAQGHPPFDALRLSVWLHGRAGDLWQQQHRTSAGLSAARLPEWIVAAAAF